MAILDSPQVAKVVAKAAELFIPHFELKFESGESSLQVVHFAAHEHMSRPFELHITARSPQEGLDLGAIVGKGAGLVARRGMTHRVWTGLCSEIEQVHAEPAGLSTYKLVIVPDLWLLGQRSGHRIFQHQSIPDIVEKILGEWKIQPHFLLDRGTFPKKEYCVQYGESDLAFVSRLLEEAGIAYFFSEKKVGETKAKSELLLTDKPHAAEPRDLGPIPFVDNPNEAARLDFVTDVRIGEEVRPGRLTIRDYDFRRPGYVLLGAPEPAQGIAPEDALEQYHYMPGAARIEVDKVQDKTPAADDRSKARYDEGELKKRAERMLEADRTGKRRIELSSNAFDLGPGTVFVMDGHPRSDLAIDKKLLVIESLIQGSAVGEWRLSGEAVFAAQAYRPPRTTQKPAIDGPQSAIVVGPKGQEIHTDEFGRVRVRFHWDREGNFDDSATCWLRVSQGWAGAGFGFTQIPRVGHEVLVEFLGGDPDEPIVAGRLYNGAAKPPFVLPAQKTKSTWKSDTSPHTDAAFNEIMFEDKAGGELFFVQAQKAERKLVKQHETERTGKDRTRIVGETQVSTIGAIDSIQVGKQRLVKVVKAKDLNILHMGDPSISPKETWLEVVDKKITLTTGKATIVLDGANIVVEAKGGVRFSADGELVIQGSKTFFNCMPGQEVHPNADKMLADNVPKPQGRVLGSVLKLFHEKPKVAELDRKDQLVDIPPGKGGPLLDSIARLLGLGKKAAPKGDGPASVLDVPHREQVGGTCGLAALGMVLDYHHGKNPDAKAPTADELLAKAKEKKWTDTGGMTEANEAKLAKEYGYDATYTPNATMDDLKKSVAEGIPPLVSFSVDQAGGPQNGVDRGHYAVIKGFMEKDGKEYVIAEHGWGGHENDVWEASKFEESWKAVNYGSSPMVKVKPPAPKG